LRTYARAKISADPVYAAVLERFRSSPLPILDIGCGVGLLGFYLREAGLKNPIVGIDTDVKKVRAGQEVAARAYAGIDLIVGDARRDLAEFAGNVALLDVIHYLTDPEQHEVLAAAASRVAPGGIAVIRDCIRDGTWRYRMTWAEEWFAKTIGWLRVPRLNFPTLDALTTEFDRRDFSGEVTPLWGRTPYNNHLLVFRRPETS
jgi:SAM-dependent methyltransferase